MTGGSEQHKTLTGEGKSAKDVRVGTKRNVNAYSVTLHKLKKYR